MQEYVAHNAQSQLQTLRRRQWPRQKIKNKQLNREKQAAEHHDHRHYVTSPHYLGRRLPRKDRVDGRPVTIVRVNVDKNNRPMSAVFAKQIYSVYHF